MNIIATCINNDQPVLAIFLATCVVRDLFLVMQEGVAGPAGGGVVRESEGSGGCFLLLKGRVCWVRSGGGVELEFGFGDVAVSDVSAVGMGDGGWALDVVYTRV